MDPVDLDELLDGELKALPTPRAPRTLLPRVLAATEGRSVPATPATGWHTWSRGWQFASIGIFVAVVAAIWVLITVPPAGVSAASEAVNDTATVVRVFWNVLLQPVAIYIFVLGVTLALACAAAWAALEFALGGASHR